MSNLCPTGMWGNILRVLSYQMWCCIVWYNLFFLLPGLLTNSFYPEGGGSIFLWNVIEILPDYMEHCVVTTVRTLIQYLVISLDKPSNYFFSAPVNTPGLLFHRGSYLPSTDQYTFNFPQFWVHYLFILPCYRYCL
jgi:hypothetical protein